MCSFCQKPVCAAVTMLCTPYADGWGGVQCMCVASIVFCHCCPGNCMGCIKLCLQLDLYAKRTRPCLTPALSPFPCTSRQEAAAIIAQRPENPREFFRQQERVASASSETPLPFNRTGREHPPLHAWKKHSHRRQGTHVGFRSVCATVYVKT